MIADNGLAAATRVYLPTYPLHLPDFNLLVRFTFVCHCGSSFVRRVLEILKDFGLLGMKLINSGVCNQ